MNSIRRQTSKLFSIIGQFFYRKRRVAVPAATTEKFYFDPPWESDGDFFSKVTLASGTQWRCDTQGNLQFFKSKDAELKAVILEFFEYNGVPSVFFFDSEEHLVTLDRLCEIYRLGMPPHMMHFNRSYYTEDRQRDVNRLGYPECQGPSAEAGDTQEQGDDADRLLGPLDPPGDKHGASGTAGIGRGLVHTCHP